VRQVVGQAADLSFLDACFYSGDELPGRDMSKIPHPLVTDTLARLEGLEDRWAGAGAPAGGCADWERRLGAAAGQSLVLSRPQVLWRAAAAA
jgi:hypothetical protein